MSRWNPDLIPDTTNDADWELEYGPTAEEPPVAACVACGCPCLVEAMHDGRLCPRCTASVEAHTEVMAREWAEEHPEMSEAA